MSSSLGLLSKEQRVRLHSTRKQFVRGKWSSALGLHQTVDWMPLYPSILSIFRYVSICTHTRIFPASSVCSSLASTKCNDLLRAAGLARDRARQKPMPYA